MPKWFLVLIFVALSVAVGDSSVEASGAGVHVVRPGDTLWAIAREHNTTVAYLATVNGIANPSLIWPGQVVRYDDAPEASTGSAAVDWALTQAGKPYRWGGNGPDVYDCSGLTQQALLREGVLIPRTAEGQREAATPVDAPSTGDLAFFGDDGEATHVGLVVDDDELVHSVYPIGVRRDPIERVAGYIEFLGYGRAY